MVIVLERSIKDHDKNRIREFLTSKGFQVREIAGEEETILGAVGQLSIDLREVETLEGVQRVIPISKPYKLASREMKQADSVVSVGKIKIGGRRIGVIAGPCSVESFDLLLETATIVKQSGAVMLRGGAFKPRTSPYAFQGLGEEGLRHLRDVSGLTGLPVVTEIVSPSHVEMMCDYIDVFQIGARNMQNFELLKAVGPSGKAVMLKRGLSATIEEWLMAAEYLLAHGAEDVILCERGIRTFETYTRNSLDISSIPVVKKLSHLPVIVDPSHATGIRNKVPPVALAAIAAGADGLIIEVHPRPEKALSDGPQSLYPEQFEKLMRDIQAMSPVLEKEVTKLPDGSEPRTVFPTIDTSGSGSEPESVDVAFQGELGAYSEIALGRYFQADGIVSRPCPSFRDVFEAVLTGKVRYGVLPVENSLAGSIHENYDLLLQYPDICIAGETKMRIIHSLITAPTTTLEQVKLVRSHPQALSQCAQFLDQHPDWERVPFYDTSGSVAYLSEKGTPGDAAIAHSETARRYGMKVLAEGIETNPQNYTRFVIIAREENAAVGAPDLASIVFATPDESGSLFACLQLFAKHELNMKKLESRPIHGRPWQYMFYVDLEIGNKLDVVNRCLDELGAIALDLRVLGMYRSA